MALPERLDILFLPNDDKQEMYYLYHHDISWKNLLATETGVLTAFVDWESVCVLSWYKTCQLPEFIDGPDRADRPKMGIYGYKKDGNFNELYFEHLKAGRRF